MSNLKITVIGVGSWALSVAMLVNQNGHDTHVWAYSESAQQQLTSQRVSKRLPNIHIPSNISFHSSMASAVQASDLVFVCLPSSYLDETLHQLKKIIHTQPICCLTKGLVASADGLMSTLFNQLFPNNHYACLSGPNLALEIAQGKPGAAVVACNHDNVSEMIQMVLSQDRFRVYRSVDVAGVQLGGILKNIIAIAAGCSDALGFGSNGKAALVTRGLREMIDFGVSYGAQAETFYGLSGMGDLMATCNSTKSRNYSVGFQLGSGEKLTELSPDLVQLAEGIRTTKIVSDMMLKQKLIMPITEEVFQVLYRDKNPKKAVTDLMSRELKAE
ncbi:glycerol-3-phosphate dehydrogenase [Candidatus Marinamargulisbacteria bacterium SCGC AG-414-C22]|nr:glycerol-3-phosphate dehydrogenase [Candidatus Marinamargulisbacteria bacterium SCGC AG-414-C22]